MCHVIFTRARERHEPKLEEVDYFTTSSFTSATASSPTIWAPTERCGEVGEDDLAIVINPTAWWQFRLIDFIVIKKN